MMDKVFTVDFWLDIIQSAGRQALYASWAVVKIVIVYFVAKFILNNLIDRVCFPIIAYERAGQDDSQLRRLRTLQTL